MQNASNEKRKVSTNYLSGNHRLSVRVDATATPVQAVHVRTEKMIVYERAGKPTMCFTSAAKTASLPGTKHNGRNNKIHVSSAGVLTGKTKSSRQPETTSIPVTSEFSRRW